MKTLAATLIKFYSSGLRYIPNYVSIIGKMIARVHNIYMEGWQKSIYRMLDLNN